MGMDAGELEGKDVYPTKKGRANGRKIFALTR
jgi:hypothetical protein